MIITRFAPSPTGNLHIGGLRTALFCYLRARNTGGKFLLRIEDTDVARNKDEAIKGILDAFAWSGLKYDGEAIYQSQRFPLYEQYAKKLLELGKAYYCYMSKEELEKLRETQTKEGKTAKYDNRYRDFVGIPPKDVKPVIRIKAPLNEDVIFNDGVKGDIVVNSKELDDFIIMRSDGTPTYNFCVVVDDVEMEINEVIRGDDHVSNTPKQIIIYDALGKKPPKFYHVPMILNPQGKKLSKRDGAMGVMDYKSAGFLPEAIINFLSRLGWSHGDQEIFGMPELLKFFDPKDLNTSPSAFNQDKLLWLNHHYIMESTDLKLESLLQDFNVDIKNLKEKSLLLKVVKERSKTIKELAQNINDVFNEPQSYENMEKVFNAESLKILEKFAIFLESKLQSEQNADSILKEFLSENSLKAGDLYKPLRTAMLGKSGGIELWASIDIVGFENSLKRVQKAIKVVKS